MIRNIIIILLVVTLVIVLPAAQGQEVIEVDGRSTGAGLYYIGEVTGGIHGRNRLMGNSLLEIISFGRRAGQHAAEYAHDRPHTRGSIEHVSDLRRTLTLAGLPMEHEGPLLFPKYARFESDSDYDGLHRSKKE